MAPKKTVKPKKQDIEYSKLKVLIKEASKKVETLKTRVGYNPNKRNEYGPTVKVLDRWLTIANAKAELMLRNLPDDEFFELGINEKLEFF